MDVSVTLQRCLGSLIPDTLFSASQNILLNFVSSEGNGVLSDESGQLSVGETVSIDGNDFIFQGSGTAQPGVDLFGLVLPLGSAVDILVLTEVSTGNTYFVYPDGTPNLLGAFALIISASPVGYDLTTNSPICFCRGTLIQTPDGERPVETLRANDVVLSGAGEPLRILWAGSMRYEAPVRMFPPIVMEPGALGPNLPRRRLRVSPWHRLPIPGRRADLVPLLAPAKALTTLPRIRQSRNTDPVEYHHILTERHALIRAEGQLAETLLPGPQAMKTLSPQARAGILDALACTEAELPDHPAAQPCGRLLNVAEARVLVRHIADQRAGPAWKAPTPNTDMPRARAS